MIKLSPAKTEASVLSSDYGIHRGYAILMIGRSVRGFSFTSKYD